MSLLGLDIGTSVCKGLVYSQTGSIIASAAREYPTLHPGRGRAELDSRKVLALIFDVIRETAAAAKTGEAGDPIQALCMSAMGEAVIPVSAARQVLGNSILFTDSRGSEYSRDLEEKIGAADFYDINPNIIGPSYSMPKICWIRDKDPALYQKTYKFLLWPDFVAFMLGCPPITNFSHANRTLLFDIRKEKWSPRLLHASGIEEEKLPSVQASGTVLGTVSSKRAEELGLEKNVRVISGAHDQCCNALGAGIYKAGKAVCGIGTVECITPVYGSIPDTRKMLGAGLNVEHHILPGLYVSFIYNQAGSLLKWFRDTFAAADSCLLDRGETIFDRLGNEMPKAPTEILMLPYFEPTGAPEFNGDMSGAIFGLNTSTSRGELYKAFMECETFYFMKSLEFLKGMSIDTSEFIASGGGARSDAWLQIKADIFGTPFVRLENPEAGTAGAAMTAGIAEGIFSGPEEAVQVFVKKGRRFEPDAERHEIYTEKYKKYLRFFDALRPLGRHA
jgi:xylulokinase